LEDEESMRKAVRRGRFGKFGKFGSFGNGFFGDEDVFVVHISDQFFGDGSFEKEEEYLYGKSFENVSVISSEVN